MRFIVRPAAALAGALALAGCASLPGDRGYAQTGDLVEARRGTIPAWPSDPGSHAETAPVPSAPLTADEAVRTAFLYSPRIREAYARLGLGRAELEHARRIANPSFGYAKLDPRDGEGTQITRSVAVSIADLLLLPARKRFAEGELERLQQTVASDLLDLAAEVETAWFESVGADQIAAMRDVVATAAEHSADLAQRFFDAGNINRLQLEQERAAASQARIAAARANANALRARSTLAGLIGLPGDAAWTTDDKLAAPPATTLSADALVPLALDQRLDLAAARQEVALREDTLGVTRRWRWLGSVEIGYERESELDGSVMRGPSLSLELPIFNQGQGAIARANAELVDARARLDGLVLDVHNQARLGVDQLTMTRDIVERYRTVLVPSREAIVARTQEQVNFMLMGVFELLLAKQQEYDAYQDYLEAVRDYWTARAELRRVVGGRLPDDGAMLEPTIGVEAILPEETAAPMDHSMHEMPTTTSKSDATDPHAGHVMPTPESRADPHAGHAMPPSAPATEPRAVDPANAPTTDPHAGHRMPMPASSLAPKPTSRARSATPPSRSQTDETEHHDHGETP